MENITREEALKAINTIREICIKNKKCDDCPFYGEKAECYITRRPDKWRIKEREIWRVFEGEDG